jgi:hypothetical protein
VAAGLRAGRLSDAQASVLVDALAVRPELEERLVAFAGQHSLRRLREECRLVKSVSRSAAEESAETHRNRTLKMWTGRDGSFRFSGSAPGPAGAEFMGRIEERKANSSTQPGRRGAGSRSKRWRSTPSWGSSPRSAVAGRPGSGRRR